MEVIRVIILVFSLIVFNFMPLSPLATLVNYSDVSVSNPSEPQLPVLSDEDQGGYVISGYLTTELDGYCTIDIPHSHWQEISSELNTNTQKYLRYKDNKTRLLMGYSVDLESKTDIPGYIVQNAAGVDMTTNVKESIQSNGKDWVIVKSAEPINNENIRVYYIVDKDNTSAFWMRVTMNVDMTEEDLIEFDDVMSKMLQSYDMYYLGSRLFETPTTGYYAGINNEEDENDQTGYKENDEGNLVFGGRGGFIKDADISPYWTDLEIIIDGNKFKLPCRMQDFYDAGFSIYSSGVSGEYEIVQSGEMSISVINNIGTRLDLLLKNDSVNDYKVIDEAVVESIKLDKARFVSIADIKEEKESSNEEETSEVGDEEGQGNSEESSVEEELENESQAVEQYQESSDESVEQKVTHGLVLAGGVTWDVYTDDLKALYGACTVSYPSDGIVQLTYKVGNTLMIIKMGILKGIEYVYLSTVGY